MKNNGIIKYKESFISKMKKFLKNLFKSKKEKDIYEQEISDSNKKEKEHLNDIRVDTKDINKYVDKKNFLEYINGNIEALNLLSTDRLKNLKEYYDGIIEENDNIIKKLKHKTN